MSMAIMPALWAVIGGLRGALVATAAVAFTASSLALYDRAIDDPAVARVARLEFVARAELEAAKARLAEAERQRDAGAQALEEFRQRFAAQEQVERAEDARHEKEIADYEKKLAAQGRGCVLDDGDIEFLRRP